MHGASPSILVDAHPHIGTDKLPRVIETMRERIKSCGGEVHFETRVDRLLIHDGEAIGVETNRGETFMGPVILATGHSARDVYRYLYQACVWSIRSGSSIRFNIIVVRDVVNICPLPNIVS